MADDRTKAVEAVMRLWDVALDTERISKVLGMPQHDAERFLHEGLNARRRAREGQAAYVHDDSR